MPKPCTCHLHTPSLRMQIDLAGGWEMRAFARNEPAHQEHAGRGELHLQLFHRATRTSILTRSPLTDGKFEVFHGGRRYRACCWSGVTKSLPEGLPGPVATWVKDGESFWVHLSMLGCSRPATAPASHLRAI